MGKREKDLKKVNFALMGFTSITTYPVGVITLWVYLGYEWKTLTIKVTFIVVNAPTSYNSIQGHSTLKLHQMVHSIYHQLMKFQTPHRIGVVRGDKPVARSCYVHSVCHHFLKKKESLSI